MPSYCFHIELTGSTKEQVLDALSSVNGCTITHASPAVAGSFIIVVDTELGENAALAAVNAALAPGAVAHKTGVMPKPSATLAEKPSVTNATGTGKPAGSRFGKK